MVSYKFRKRIPVVIYMRQSNEKQQKDEGQSEFATYTTVQPNDNLIISFRVLRREVPEVQRRISPITIQRVVRRTNWHQTRITLANIKVHIRDCRSIDSIFYVLISKFWPLQVDNL